MMSTEHPLLEARSPAYTHATVRRAFIVWLRCGRRNNFQDVCNFYHHLEAMEDKLPADSRASSRNHEFSLFANQPPTSLYQQKLFPSLYTSSDFEVQSYAQTYVQNHFQRTIDHANNIIDVEEMQAGFGNTGVTHQDIFNASQIFKYPPPPYRKVDDKVRETLTTLYNNIDGLEKLNLDKETNGTSKHDIVETSQMIRNYCKEKQVPFKNFLENFKEYSARCELQNTVNNVGFYIKRKTIHEELKLAAVVHKAKRYNNANKNRAKAKKASRRSKTEKINNVKNNGVDPLNFYDIIDKMAECVPEETENKCDNDKIVVEDVKLQNGAIEEKAEMQKEEEEFVDACNTTNEEVEKYTDASSVSEIDNELQKTETSFENNDILIQIDINLKSADTKLEIISSDKSEGEDHNEDNTEFTQCNDGAITLLKRENSDDKNNNTGFSRTHIVKLDVQKCRKI